MDERYFEKLGRTEEGFSEVMYKGQRKKIFLIGDSICRGYRPFVKENFKDTYDVVYPEENCRNSQYIITSLFGWANAFEDTSDVELVSFNCGHWDISHWNGEEESLTNITEYANNIKRIIAHLRNFFPKAKILFLTTTPMNPSYKKDSQNIRTNEEIIQYNAVALEVAKEQGVFTEDLFTFMENWDASNFIDYVHLTPNAAQRLGNHITDVISKIIKGDE